jgi:hypothetical protein
MCVRQRAHGATFDVCALDLGCGQAREEHPILVVHRRFLLPHSSSASELFARRYSFFLFDQVVIAVTDSLSVAP